MKSEITCIAFTRPTRTPVLTLASGDDWHRSSQTAAAKSSCSTRCFSPCREHRLFITAMRLGWATIFIWAIATVAAHPCNGARTVMRDFQERIRSSFICRLRSIRNITTKLSTLRTSKRISPPCFGGCGGSLRCGKTSRRFRAVHLNFSIRITPRCSHFFDASRMRQSLSL